MVPASFAVGCKIIPPAVFKTNDVAGLPTAPVVNTLNPLTTNG